MVATAPTTIDPHFDPHSIVAVLGGTNDCANSIPASTAWANLVTYGNARHAVGFKTIVLTVPFDSTDTCRQAVNTLIRANWNTGPYDGLADDAAALSPSDSFDGTHPTTAASQTIIAPLIQTQVNALVP